MLGTWEDPPTDVPRNRKWDSTFREIKNNPGRWAKLFEGKDKNAHSLGGRLRKNYPDFEVKTQTLAPVDGVKQAGVWARYLEPVTTIQNQHDHTTDWADSVTEATGGDPYGHGGGASLDG